MVQHFPVIICQQSIETERWLVVLKIALFDEDPSYLREILKNLNEQDAAGQVSELSDFDELLAMAADEIQKPDAVFFGLRQDSKQQTLQRAQELFALSRQIPVIYVADGNEIWDQTILFGNVNLIGFITLPLEAGVLSRYLRKIEELKEEAQLLTVKVRGKDSYIRMENILYMESRKHVANVHTDGGIVTTYEKLSSLLPRLPGNFVQVHKSYLVNADRVSLAEQNTLILDNGERIPVSRSRKNEVKERLMRMGGNAKGKEKE